jgi:hypothetical protein
MHTRIHITFTVTETLVLGEARKLFYGQPNWWEKTHVLETVKQILMTQIPV